MHSSRPRGGAEHLLEPAGALPQGPRSDRARRGARHRRPLRRFSVSAAERLFPDAHRARWRGRAGEHVGRRPPDVGPDHSGLRAQLVYLSVDAVRGCGRRLHHEARRVADALPANRIRRHRAVRLARCGSAPRRQDRVADHSDAHRQAAQARRTPGQDRRQADSRGSARAAHPGD